MLMVVAAALVTSCQSAVQDGEGVSDPTLGLISDGNDGQVIRAPDTVSANESFQVTVFTFGSSSCGAADHVDLKLSSSLAIITPHDRSSGEATCTADVAARAHPVELRFTAVGIANIHVVGAVISNEGVRVMGSADQVVVVRR
jgi:hypothetical protein